MLRDCLSGEVLLAKSLLSATAKDIAALIAEVKAALPVPITGALSDGQESIRKAVAEALPGVPHQLCQSHYLRQAAKPAYEADRHVKKELKKRPGASGGSSARRRGPARTTRGRGWCAAIAPRCGPR